MKDLPPVVKIDVGDLDSEKENLANFLHIEFQLDSSIIREGLKLNMDEAPAIALARMVNKFVYRKNLNRTHWVAVKNNVVKINRFKPQTKVKENKHPTTPSTIKHGW